MLNLQQVLLIVLAVTVASAQRLEFEVASVKRNTTNGPMDGRPRRSGDLILMHNTQPYSMIYYAYHLHGSYEMAGYVRFAPDEWNWFDVEARIGRDASEDEVRLMFQSLLEDRFKLKAHRETREIPEYVLTIAKGSSKLVPASEKPMTVSIEGKTLSQPAGACGTTLWNDGAHLVCHAVTVDKIVAEAAAWLRAPVADHSGLTGTYDLHVRYVSEERKVDPDLATAPLLPQAFQEELGLKLEKGKGPVEVLVIDHIEKPTPNQ